MFQLPRECRLFAALNPASQWGWIESLANKTNYLLELIAWQNATPSTKAKKAAHEQKKPKPYVPDFMKKDIEPQGAINEGIEQMSVDDVKSWLAVPRGE
jgi:hypothetical protein